ncbi:Motile sperm domain-containing protein 2 [Fragariocoptes setiger]|uniref:Motile sperm domain-containing protein 2 n=1 Tax=Fragariocoptes setiger TaxID=1670756 RepID=A0ABQ7SAX3_9ACAR|nr:Motile sperm domain-containing protein 2 [Fragariocoptes setiger]
MSKYLLCCAPKPSHEQQPEHCSVEHRKHQDTAHDNSIKMPNADETSVANVIDVDLNSGSGAIKDDKMEQENDKQLLDDIRRALLDKINLADFDKSEIERFQNDDYAVKRYLRHEKDRQATVGKTAAFIRDVLVWRRDMDLPNIKERDFSDSIKQLKTWVMKGKDKNGANMFWLRACHHRSREVDADEARRHLAYRFECIDRISDQCGWVCCWDCQQVGTANIDLDMVRFITNSLPYFRGNLRYVLVHDMGWIATTAWKVIRGWLPQEHRDAVKIASRKELKDFVDNDQLPEYFHS